MKERRYDIDWLRVIAMLTVFFFHCSRFFCTEEWHLKVPVAQQSEVLRIVRDMLVGVWFMELFFLVSGFASWYALKSRSGRQYLGERVKRLVVPLYIVGLFVLVVPQQYFDGITKGYITGGFWQWLPSYYTRLPAAMLANWVPWLDPASLLPFPFTGHLWFIRTLFVVSLVTLPALQYLRSEQGKRFIDRLAGWVDRPGGIFLFLIPLAIAQIALRWIPNLPDRTWSEFVWYALYFLIGYIFAADERFTVSVKRYTWLCLALWIGVYVVMGSVVFLILQLEPSEGSGFSGLYLVYVTSWTVISWSAIVFMLSLGARYLNFSNRFLTYSNEAVLPFYLFHQTVILTVGWFVLPWDINNLAKYLVIVAISFSLIMALYEGFVRHIGFMRVLFGMAPQKKGPAAPAG